MNQTLLVPIALSLMLAACSDSTEIMLGAGGAGTGTGATTGSPDQSASSGATTSGNPTTGSGTPIGDTVTLTMDSFDIPPGAEVYKCQNFANPFGGAEAEVAMFESHMTPGSHHLLLFYEDGATDTKVEDCSGLEFGPTPYSTQLSQDSVSFPPGVAAVIPPSKGLRMQSHYLNTTQSTITAEVKITFHLAAPGTVKDHAGVMFVVQPFILVPPNSTKDVKHTCDIPFDMFALKTASHMHKHGTKFTSNVGGLPFYDTTEWAEPKPSIFDPPRQLKAGEKLSFTCTFVNNSPDTLTFGESAESNEMCILVTSFYPLPSSDPTIDCN